MGVDGSVSVIDSKRSKRFSCLAGFCAYTTFWTALMSSCTRTVQIIRCYLVLQSRLFWWVSAVFIGLC